MVIRAKCPLCGMMCWPSQIKKNHVFQMYQIFSLGKGHGSRFDFSNDSSLVDMIKRKIKVLYERFCLGVSTLPSVFVSVIPEGRTWLIPSLVAEVPSAPEIQTYPPVR